MDRVLLEKQMGYQLVKKFSLFSRTRRLINYPIYKCLPPVPILNQTTPIHSSNPTSWRSIFILSYHLRLGLPSCLFPSGLHTKTIYTPHLSPMRATQPRPSYSSLFDFFFSWRVGPARAITSSFVKFVADTQRRTTVGRSTVGEWSVRRRDFYLTTHNTRKTQTSMPLAGSNSQFQQTIDRRPTMGFINLIIHVCGEVQITKLLIM